MRIYTDALIAENVHKFMQEVLSRGSRYFKVCPPARPIHAAEFGNEFGLRVGLVACDCQQNFSIRPGTPQLFTRCVLRRDDAKGEHKELVGRHCSGYSRSVKLIVKTTCAEKEVTATYHEFPRLSRLARLFALFECLFIWEVDGREARTSQKDGNCDTLRVHTHLHDFLRD